MSNKDALWWEAEIVRLPGIIKKLDSDISRVTYGPAIQPLLEERAKWQGELDNALRAAQAHANRGVQSYSATRPADRGKHCAQVIDEMKRVKNLSRGSGYSVAEIERENPGWMVWKIREELAEEDRELFNHPNRWGTTVGYAKIVLSKSKGVSTHTIDSWVKAYRKRK